MAGIDSLSCVLVGGSGNQSRVLVKAEDGEERLGETEETGLQNHRERQGSG